MILIKFELIISLLQYFSTDIWTCELATNICLMLLISHFKTISLYTPPYLLLGLTQTSL